MLGEYEGKIRIMFMVKKYFTQNRPCPQVAGLIKNNLPVIFKSVIIYTMSEIVGYMVTWTTYGSWLPGDERGYVENGQILPGDTQILKRNMNRQKCPTVRLNAQEKEIVQRVILAEAEKIGHEIQALVVCANHVHLLALPHSVSIEDTVARYKSLTTRTLWQCGRKGRIWTKGYDKRFCFTEEEIVRRKQYIENHKND